MSVPVLKALTKRIRIRLGSAEIAARAAGLANKGKWSVYESADHPNSTLPIHRFMAVANAEETAALIDLLQSEAEQPTKDVLEEACEAAEAASELQAMARAASRGGPISESRKRELRAKALQVKAEVEDVLEAAA